MTMLPSFLSLVQFLVFVQILRHAWDYGTLINDSFDPNDPLDRTTKTIVNYHLWEAKVYIVLPIISVIISAIITELLFWRVGFFGTLSIVRGLNVVEYFPTVLLMWKSPVPDPTWPAADRSENRSLFILLRNNTFQRVAIIVLMILLMVAQITVERMFDPINPTVTTVLRLMFQVLTLIEAMLLWDKLARLGTMLNDFANKRTSVVDPQPVAEG